MTLPIFIIAMISMCVGVAVGAFVMALVHTGRERRTLRAVKACIANFDSEPRLGEAYESCMQTLAKAGKKFDGIHKLPRLGLTASELHRSLGGGALSELKHNLPTRYNESADLEYESWFDPYRFTVAIHNSNQICKQVPE